MATLIRRKLRARPSLTPNLRPLRVAFAGQKGGAGKTTSATSLAHEGVRRGRKVLFCDRDKQGTASITFRIGVSEGLPVPSSCDLDELVGRLDGAEAGYDLVVIDCPPGDEARQREALELCDIALIPCGQTGPDQWSIYGNGKDPDNALRPKTLEVVRRVQREGNQALLAYVLINNVHPQSADGRKVRQNLAVPGGLPVLGPELWWSALYGAAFDAGAGITTYMPRSRAAGQVRDLFDAVWEMRAGILRLKDAAP